MKKFLIAAATLAMLSTSSFADQNLENMNKMDALRKMKFEVMMQINESTMEMLRMREAVLTNYQRLLKQMMLADEGGDK